MKVLLIAVTLMACMIQHSAIAHGSHGVDAPSAIAIVYQSVPKLAEKDYGFEVGKLDESWKSITASDVSVVETDGDFYVMQATNPKSKAAIFLLIGINGQIIQVKNSSDF